MTLKVLIDGVEVGAALNDVKVIVNLSDEHGDVHLTVTDEGVIVDVVRDGEIASSVTYDLFDLTAEDT